MTAAGSMSRRWVRLTTRCTFQFALRTGMTVRSGPSPGRNRCVSAGFDRDDICTDGTDSQRRSDPGPDVAGVH